MNDNKIKLCRSLTKYIVCLFILPFILIDFGCKNPDEYKPDHELADPPAPPELIHPSPDTIFNGGTFILVPFDWQIIAGAEIYEIQIDTIETFKTDSIHQVKAPPIYIKLTHYYPRTTYFCRIRAGSSLWTYYTAWSEPRRFYLYPEG